MFCLNYGVYTVYLKLVYTGDRLRSLIHSEVGLFIVLKVSTLLQSFIRISDTNPVSKLHTRQVCFKHTKQNLYTAIKDINKNDFLEIISKIFSSFRFEKSFWLIYLIRVNHFLWVTKAILKKDLHLRFLLFLFKFKNFECLKTSLKTMNIPTLKRV